MVTWASASDLDRVDHQRGSPDWVAQQWDAEGARLLPLTPTSQFATDATGTALRMAPPDGAYDAQRHRLLGLLHGAPIFAVEEATDGPVHDLRQVGAQLSDSERDIAAAAAAVENWHRLEPYCPRCGGPTRVINGGFARHCQACGRDHFPRTDPAVIVAVIDDQDRLLLGGQATWGTRVSVLAGFVEAGESLEQTVHREIGEEADVRLSDICYFGSQPWPFPRSVMVGFFARAVTTAISVDADELTAADWYTRDQLTARLGAGDLGLPGESSIAARLIRTWRDHRAPL